MITQRSHHNDTTKLDNKQVKLSKPVLAVHSHLRCRYVLNVKPIQLIRKG